MLLLVYGLLFGGDFEFFVNCMVVVCGYVGFVGCNGD